MSKKHKIHVKVGDIIRVISGISKNQIGEVLKINRKNGTLLVKGINIKFKSLKPKTKNKIGEIKQYEFPIHHSNVRLNLK